MILITGATGFLGRNLVNSIVKTGQEIRACSRLQNDSLFDFCQVYPIGDISENTNWNEALQDIELVIHCAARAHIMNDTSLDPLAEFRKVNTAGTLNLARQAAESGVRRFIFMSSIKVNGELTEGTPFSPEDSFKPTDPYGLSKYEAEQGLLALAKETGMEIVIIRPTLVYGSGVKGNFANLLKWMKKGVPLPFGAIHNQRSFIALDNLVSFIIHCIDHPKAANEIFLISDGKDVSTTELLEKVVTAFGKRPFLIPVPVSLMRFAANTLGKESVANRLLGSLQVNSSKAYKLLGWTPVVSMDEQLKKMAKWDKQH